MHTYSHATTHFCSSESVKEYLENYFVRSQEALDGKIDENLCLLCIQCFEVKITKNYTIIIL